MKRNIRQKGTTILELAVAMAITGMMLMGVVALIFQEWRGTASAKTTVAAAQEIGNAARWISQDGMMAESTGLVEGDPPVDHVTLMWIERYEFANIPHSSSYYLSDTRLCREYDGTVSTVARNISGIEFSRTGNLITVTVSCAPGFWVSDGTGTVSRSYQIYLRAAESLFS